MVPDSIFYHWVASNGIPGPPMARGVLIYHMGVFQRLFTSKFFRSLFSFTPLMDFYESVFRWFLPKKNAKSGVGAAISQR